MQVGRCTPRPPGGGHNLTRKLERGDRESFYLLDQVVHLSCVRVRGVTLQRDADRAAGGIHSAFCTSRKNGESWRPGLSVRWGEGEVLEAQVVEVSSQDGVRVTFDGPGANHPLLGWAALLVFGTSVQ